MQLGPTDANRAKLCTTIIAVFKDFHKRANIYGGASSHSSLDVGTKNSTILCSGAPH